MIFWDTSALIKSYGTLEAAHERAKNLLTREKGHKGSSLLWPETLSGIVRKLGSNRRVRESLLGLLEEHLKHFDLLPITDDQIELSVKLVRKHRLRAAEAIHLAAALLLSRIIGRKRMRFVTADAAQADAARGEEFKVIELAA